MTTGHGTCHDFTIDVPEHVQADLRRRLAATRWPDGVAGSGWTLGTDLDYMRELCAYWLDGFDWRAQEAQLNARPNFVVDIDEVRMHFIHERGGVGSMPLLLLHGWPSSVWEFHNLLGRLDRERLTLVVPSLPGYGFSFRPFQRRCGILECADVLAALMTDVLGCDRFAVAGGDWGAYVAARMAYRYPDAVAGLHLNMVPLRRTAGFPPEPTDEERAYLQALDVWQREQAGYSLLLGTVPQTPAFALTDSPAGLAAWIVEKFQRWSDNSGDLENCFSKDDLLTTVMLYWATGAIGSSFWPYFTRHHGEWTVNDLLAEGARVAPPLYYIDFPRENIRPPKSVAEHFFDVRRWTVAEAGGHFPALEQPAVLADSLARFADDVWATRVQA
jgi:pimeloyl-ACP methyl ester carboxylesterase